MTFVSCSIDEQFVNPLFEVFDGGDFVLSSYHDIEEDFTRMRIFFEDPSQAEDAKRSLKAALDLVGVSLPIEVGEIPDEDWKLAYRRHFKIEEIGRRLVTVPAWEKVPEGTRIPLILDPGMAFGTGKHETTHACLEYIDELAPPLSSLIPQPSFLDMGCGSGILSIAAAKLGFAPVHGFDIDEEAVKASRENAEKNNVSVDYCLFALGKGTVTCDETIEAAKGIYPDLALQSHLTSDLSSPSSLLPQYDLVVANILGPLLIAFADEIITYVKKDVILSGILSELYPEVLAAFASKGFKEVSRKTLGEWTTGHLTREEHF